jgi:hypothetical protein
MKVVQRTKVENHMVPVTRTVVVMEAQAVKQRIFTLELREEQIKAFYAMCNNIHVILDAIDRTENEQLTRYRNGVKDLLDEGFTALYGEYGTKGLYSNCATGEVLFND